MSGINDIASEARQGLPALTADEIKAKLKSRFRGNKTRPTPMLILGPAGVGKTRLIYDVVKELGIGFQEVVLSEYEPTDLAGIPRIMDRDDITPDMESEVKTTADRYRVEHIRPKLLPDPIKADYAMKKYCEMNNKKPEEVTFEELPVEARQYIYGILFFDEVPAAPVENRVAAAKLLDKSRRIDSYELPERWLVVCAGNGPEDGGVYDNLEGFFFNRCQGMRFEPDADVWLNWAAGPGKIHPVIIAFIKNFPDYLWDRENDPVYTMAFSSPRAWELASQELTGFLETKPEGYVPTSREVYLNIAGIVSEEAAQKFTTYYGQCEQIIPLDEIEAGTARTNIGDNNPEVTYLQASLVAARLVKRAQEFLDTPYANRNFNTLKNLLNWTGKFCNSDLNAGIELIRQCLVAPGPTGPLFLIMQANMTTIQAQCPDFVKFYTDNKKMYEFI